MIPKPTKQQIANSIYQDHKTLIKNVANSEQLKDADIPSRTQALESLLNSLVKDLQYFVIAKKITELQSKNIALKLTNYTVRKYK